MKMERQWVKPVAGAYLALYAACAGEDLPPALVQEATEQETIGGQTGTGGGSASISLPVPYGVRLMCTQGPHGAWSHHFRSTQFDLDFDTPNDRDDQVFAPVAGEVFVHDEGNSGFGKSVSIVLSDGVFVLIGHFKEVLVQDGQRVSIGQLVGVEGHTGASEGDHIHIGLHRGDPSLPPSQSESVPAAFLVQGTYGDAQELGSEDFVCGIPGGQSYRSLTGINSFHPNGTLVKAAGDAKVYRLDNGELRWIPDEATFREYGYRFRDVVVISDEEMKCYAVGLQITTHGGSEAIYDRMGQLWLLVGPLGRDDRYRIRVAPAAWDRVLASWGIDDDSLVDRHPPVVEDSDGRLTDYPVKHGFAKFRDGTLIKESGDPKVYVVTAGRAFHVKDMDAFNLMNYKESNLLAVPDGSLGAIMGQVGDCLYDSLCIDRDMAQSCGMSLQVGGEGEDSEELRPAFTSGQQLDKMNLRGNEFGVVYQAPIGIEAHYVVLSGQVKNRLGEIVVASGEFVRGEDGYLEWKTALIGEGDLFDFVLTLYTPTGMRYACQNQEVSGDLAARYGQSDLTVLRSEEQTGPCRFLVRLQGGDPPGMPPVSSADAGVSDSGSLPDCPQGFVSENGQCRAVSQPDAGAMPSSDSGLSQSQPDVGTNQSGSSVLRVTWLAPLGQIMDRITISGEYRLANGTFGFTWQELSSVQNATSIEYEIANASVGDYFRFSVEYRSRSGNVSWSCIRSPHPDGAVTWIPQGSVTALYGGHGLSVTYAGDPSGFSDGCGPSVTVR